MLSTGQQSQTVLDATSLHSVSTQELRDKLNEGLRILGIDSVRQLDDEVHAKETEVTRLANLGDAAKPRLTARRKSLVELKNLQVIAAQVAQRASVVETKAEIKNTHEKKASEGEVKNTSSQASLAPEIKRGEQSTQFLPETKLSTGIVLEGLSAIIKDVPPCAERSVDCLLSYIELKKNGDKTFPSAVIQTASMALETKGDAKGSGSIDVDQAIKKELMQLKEFLKTEELESNGVILQWIKECEKFLKMESWSEAQRYFNLILRELRPFNIQELFRLVEKTEQAAEKVKDQKVLLLLGGTGTGKSTTIHYLAGSPMKQDSMGRIIPPPVSEIKNADLREIVVGERVSQSQTRYISAVRMQYEAGGIEQSVVLCDSPGFGDTAGPEVDVANGLGIIKAIHGCQSVRPLVLVSSNSIGDKLEGFRRLTSILLSMIPSVVKNHLNSVSYAFTKYPDNSQEKEKLFKRIQQFLKEMTPDKYDQTEIAFVTHLLSKISPKGGQQRLKIINPLDSHQNAIDYLDDLLGPDAPASIEYPANAFVPFMTNDSKEAVNSQAAKHKFAVISAMKRGDYHLIGYKLNELNKLSELLPEHASIRNALEECIKHVIECMNRDYTQRSRELNRCLEDGSSLKSEDLELYKRYIEEIGAAKEIRAQYLKKATVQEDSYLHILTQWLNSVVTTIDKELNHSQGLDRQQVLATVAARLDKVKLVAKHFPGFKSSYTQACSVVDTWLNGVIASGRDEIQSKKFDFNKIAGSLGQLQSALSIFKDHIDYDKNLKKYHELRETLMANLKNVAAFKVESKDERVKFTEMDIKNLALAFETVEQALSANLLHAYIDKNEIKAIYQELCDKVLANFNDIYSEIDAKFKQEKEKFKQAQSPIREEKSSDSFQTVKPLIDELVLMRKIPAINNLTEVKYVEIIQELCRYVEGIRTDMENKLGRLLEQTDNVGYVQFGARLASLRNATWIDTIKPGTCSDAVERIVNAIIENMVRLNKQIYSLDLTLEKPQVIQQNLQALLAQVSSMCILQRDIPELTPHVDEIYAWVKENIETTLGRVKREISLEAKTTTHKKSLLDNLLHWRAQYDKLSEAQLFLKDKGYGHSEELEEKLKERKRAQDNLNPAAQEQISKLRERYNELNKASGRYNEALSKGTSLFGALATAVGAGSSQNSARDVLRAVGHESIDAVFQEMQKNNQEVRECEEKSQGNMIAVAKEISELVKQKSDYDRLRNSKSESAEQRKFLASNGMGGINELDEKIQRLRAEIDAQADYTYLFDRLELNKLEMCRAYLEACKGLQTFNKVSFNKGSIDLLDELDTFIRQYVLFLNKKITESFENTTGGTKETDKAQKEEKHVTGQATHGPSAIEVLRERIEECTILSRLSKETESRKYSADVWVKLEEGCKSVVSQWTRTLSDYHHDLSNLMARQRSMNQFNDLSNSLDIARKLGQLDSYIGGGQFSYLKLYVDFSNALIQGKSKVREDALKQIEKRDYQKVKEIMDVLKDSLKDPASAFAYDQIQKDLAYSISDLSDKTMRTIKSLDFDSDDTTLTLNKLEQTVAVNLEALKLASRTVQFYLPDIVISSGKEGTLLADAKGSTELKAEHKGDAKAEGSKVVATSKNGIVQNIEESIAIQMQRFLETLRESVENYNFTSVATKIRFINVTVLNTLDLDGYETVVRAEMDKLNKLIEQKLNELVEKYKGKEAKDALPIEKYSQHPLKDAFQKLQLAVKGNLGRKYKDTLDALSTAVSDKFRSELEALKSVPSDQQSKRRRELERALHSLPDELAQGLREEYQSTITGIDNDSKEAAASLNTAIAETEPENLANQYIRCAGDYKLRRTLQEGISKNVKNCMLNIDTKIKQGNINIDEVRKDLKKIIEYRNLFGEVEDQDIRDAVHRAYNDMQEKFMRLFENAYKALESATSGGVPDASASAKTAEDNFDIIAACIDLREMDVDGTLSRAVSQLSPQPAKLTPESKQVEKKSPKGKNSTPGDSKRSESKQLVPASGSEQKQQNTMFPADFEEKVRIISDKLATHFCENQQRFDASLSNFNTPELKQALQVKERWDGLLLKIKAKHRALSETAIKQLQECKNYAQIRRSTSEIIVNLLDKICNLNLVESEETKLHKSREIFYKDLSVKLNFLKSSRELKEFTDTSVIDVTLVEAKYTDALRHQVEGLHAQAIRLVEKLLNVKSLTIQEFTQFNNCYENLLTFQQYLPYVAIADVQRYKDHVKAQFDSVINKLEKKLTTNNAKDWKVEDVSECLIQLKYIANNVLSFKAVIDAKIDDIVDRYEKNQEGVLARLGTLLNQDKNGVGQIILAEHSRFKGCLIDVYNRKTQAQTIEYVLANLDGTDCTSRAMDSLGRAYDDFKGKYNEIIQFNLKPKIDFGRLTNEIKNLLGGRRTPRMESKADFKLGEHKGASKWHDTSASDLWDMQVKAKIPHLMAYIFAYWTLNNASHYFDAGKSKTFLLTPHPAQVISIFRMLGISERTDDLTNGLVQIGTGEGKSVTLAVTACVLALLGFDISCACYSDYLSQRDLAEFKSLFDALGVSEHIRYGTFNQLCEHILNENGSVREKVENLILDKKPAAAETKRAVGKSKRPKILLIDEVDVFFSKDFYGKIYTPSASISDPTIFKLAQYIWDNRQTASRQATIGAVFQQPLALRNIKNTSEYKECVAKFPKWEFLITEAVKDMVATVKDMTASIDARTYVPDYIVQGDKLAYKDNDAYSTSVVLGYKTLFSYFYEHELGKISQKSLEENVSIQVRCGSFSYAEIPHLFAKIMGVTGTLRHLSAPEKHVVKTVYKISRETFIPSVFGTNNMDYKEERDIRIEAPSDYFGAIAQDTLARLQGTLKGTKRAVISFFDDKRSLMECYNSHAYATVRSTGAVNRLTEELTEEERNQIIKRATTSGQITLCTSAFARGTDFTCHDEMVLANGGVHIQKNYLSPQYSEEVQARGRGARQGTPGTFNLIICDDSRLEKLQVTRADLNAIKAGEIKAYETLNKRRNDWFALQYENNDRFVQAAKGEHEQGRKFIASIHSGDEAYIRKFLGERNKGAAEKPQSRTICLMDATGSMSHLLQSSKNTVETMFSRATQVLAEHKDDKGKPKIEPNAFQMQFAVYRNYNCPAELLLQSSPWEVKAENLRNFMSTIDVDGGLGNEAIEIGLWHVNREAEAGLVTQVILIGDMPANTREEVAEHRKTKHGGYILSKFGGESYWQKTRFKTPTYYQDELKELKSRGIPVHAFYIDNCAKKNFKEIAAATGGRAEELDVNSPQGADVLTNLVTEAILRDIDEEKGDGLVEKYRAMFGNRTYKSS